MKRKNQEFYKNLKMPCLFREDIENIEKIIKEELKPDVYKLESELYEYQEVKEISNDESPSNQFFIRTYFPSITVSLTKKYASIYADDDDIKTTGAIKKIIDVIHKRERVFLWYSSLFGQFLAFFIFSLSVLFLSTISLFNLELKYVIIIAILSAVWLTITLVTFDYKFSVVEFTHRKNRSNFFLETKINLVWRFLLQQYLLH